MHIYFILVNPKEAGNIGASARAIKNMGFNNLVIVKDKKRIGKSAWWMAHGAKDILEKAVFCSNLKEAVSGMDLVVGTTSKVRAVRHRYYTCSELPGILKKKKKSVKKVAILFGNEDTGLHNDELRYCDIYSVIPMAARYPSLNLAQATMVYAYSLFKAKVVKDKGSVVSPGDPGQLGSLREKIDGILELLGYGRDSFMLWRIRERIGGMGDKDIGLLHVICDSISYKLKRQGKQPYNDLDPGLAPEHKK